MALYALVDERGNFLEERVIDPPLQRKEIEFWPNRQPKIVPLTVEEPPFDPETHQLYGFTFINTPSGMIKRRMVVPLTNDEKRQRSEAREKVQFEAAVDYRRALRVMARVLLEVVERQVLTEDPADPRTRVRVRERDIERLREIKARTEAIFGAD